MALLLSNTIKKFFFLTFMQAKNLVVKFSSKKPTNFNKKSNAWYIFGFALKMGARTLNYFKVQSISFLPSAKTESLKQFQCSYLIFSQQTSLF